MEQGEAVMLDTVALWGLLFPKSRYHDVVRGLVKERRVIIHAVSLYELLYPAYRSASGAGRDVDKGLRMLRSVLKSYAVLSSGAAEVFGAKELVVLPLTLGDILEGLGVLFENLDLFVERREGWWPSIADAVIAGAWRRLRVRLATSDEALIKYGDRYGLEYVRL